MISTQAVRRYELDHTINLDDSLLSHTYQNQVFSVTQTVDIPTRWSYAAGLQLTRLNLNDLDSLATSEYRLTYLELIPVQVHYQVTPLVRAGVGAGIARLTQVEVNNQIISDLKANGYTPWEQNIFLDIGLGKQQQGIQGGVRFQLRSAYLDRVSTVYGVAQVYVGYTLGRQGKAASRADAVRQ